MSQKLPVLVIIPHGGISIPEELMGYESLNSFNLFFESDAGAIDIFSLDDYLCGVIYSNISRLFVDMDREFTELYPNTEDGVIKTKTLTGANIFLEGCYPDEIAISNILKRYYFPFHERVRNTIKDNDIRLILECHTHTPVRLKYGPGRDEPNPLVLVSYTANTKSGLKKTASFEKASDLASIMGKIFSGEGDTVAGNFKIWDNSGGYIMRNYGTRGIDMLNISLSRSLFLTDNFFDLDNLTIDSKRLLYIKELFFEGLKKFFKRAY
ncbi:MAG TPA: N-formylglutamate amidohydrolase [Spirochaetota bacterium]|jgi:formiminoglutamase|nr:N-formylglutamate amidohydrolase [Spirochaetota bacterium]OQA97123.1 MAG: N-formylglutamate amidohydrolase [Spirochaetes bacterium ADurb.Bin218]HOK01877.1 N-formylglutamate amidohydrolase [Spirochaetota bacterium]HON16525.1 N-formylglutamate amidohydrolase [Spirochaetota bacterium]HOQ11117.1 N-formylglutamate amidohydrolase [Spirochaetota bacterium]